MTKQESRILAEIRKHGKLVCLNALDQPLTDILVSIIKKIQIKDGKPA